ARYRIVEADVKNRARISGRTPCESLRYDFPFPLAYLLSRDVGQRPAAEPRENVNFDGVLVVGKRGRFQVLSRVPLVNPFDERYLTGARVNVRSVADCGFLRLPVLFGGLACREAWL